MRVGVNLLVVIVIVVGVVYAARRSRERGPVQPSPGGGIPGQPRAMAGTAGVGAPNPRPGPAGDLARWVAAGLLSEEQAAAILAHEQAAATAAPVPVATRAAPVPGRPRRVPVVAEALGYLGGMLAIIGLVLLVGQYWPDMATAGRLALSGAGALVLLGAGFVVREQEDPALARLRGFLWLASAAATAVFAGVLAADGFDADSAESVAVASAGAVATHGGLLWWWRDRPLQQLACLGGLLVLAGSSVALASPGGGAGLAVWAVGAAYVALGLRRRTPAPLLTEGIGGVAVVFGAFTTAGDWQGVGLVFAVTTAFGLLALAAVPGPARDRVDQLVLTVLGAVALAGAVPAALGYYSRDAGLATGLVTWAVGAGLVLVGARRLVRVPLVVEGLGGAAIIGGAALTGAQVTGFATIFGIVTAVALVALGMLPGQVLLSVLGSLGLLVNVPWAIGWFFPGEGRAPLLIMVSGALVIGVAVLLTRMGGRLRRELGGPRPDGGTPSGVAPGPV